MSRPPLPIAAAAVAWLVAAALALPPVASGAATFGRPQAQATYGDEIVFEQPLTLEPGYRRVEILVGLPGAVGPLVHEVAVGGRSGAQTLTYRWDAAAAHLVPNTTLTARWRVVGGDGTIVVGPEVTVRYEDTRFEWRTQEGESVRVHWYAGSDEFGRRALDIAERTVAETSALLGVTETEPIDFFVYADVESFYDALGPETRENVGGQANVELRTLFARIDPDAIDDPWVEVVVPHELVHLVFDTAVTNPYHYPPRWLNEGLAVYLSEGYSPDDRNAVEAAAAAGTLIPLDGLPVQFPATRDGFFLAYSVSVSAVDYLIRAHGRDALVRLIRSYADGVSDDEAFETALGIDHAAFDAAWRADLDAADPVAHGPRPAPAGPLPSGWQAASPGPVGSEPPPAPGERTPEERTPEERTPEERTPEERTPPVLALAGLALGGVALALLLARHRRRPVTDGPPGPSEPSEEG